VLENFFYGCALLERRARGDHAPDPKPQSFPTFTRETPKRLPRRKSVGSCFALFEAYVLDVKPAASTVNRWRAVFKALDLHLGGAKDLGSFTGDEAQEWINSLRTSGRQARTVKDIWLSAARTVCEWARKRKRLRENPFAEADIIDNLA
jgi:hypothetical protein